MMAIPSSAGNEPDSAQALTHRDDDKLPSDPVRANAACYQWKPEHFFIVVGLLFGTCFTVLTPPFQVPDEPAHFYRAFQLSTGRVISIKRGSSTGDVLPRALPDAWERFQRLAHDPDQKTTCEEIRQSFAMKVDATSTEFVSFSNTAIHPPLTYLPQLLAIWLTRSFSDSVLVSLYAGRFGNLFASLAVMYWAVRRCPVCAWSIASLALTPMSLFQMSSLSSDALTNAICFALVAQVLYCEFGQEGFIQTKDIVWAIFLGFCLGWTKQSYFLLSFSFLMVHARRFTSMWLCRLSRVAVSSSSLIAVAVWSPIVREIYSPAADNGIDPGRQVEWILSHPIDFFGVLAATFCLTPQHIGQYLGDLGWLDTPLPMILRAAELILLVVVIVGETDFRISPRHIAIAWRVSVAVVLCLYTVIYITWSPVGVRTNFLQGRYFISLGPLAAVILAGLWGQMRCHFRLERPLISLIAPLVSSITLIVSLYCVARRYYLGS